MKRVLQVTAGLLLISGFLFWSFGPRLLFRLAIDNHRSLFSPESRANLEMVFGPQDAAAAELDPSWRWIDLAHFVLPVPPAPGEITREGSSLTVSAKGFTASIGGDTLPFDERWKAFREARGLHSDYAYNSYLYDARFLSGEDLRTLADADVKDRLAMAKALDAPFKLERAVRIESAGVIYLAGPHRSLQGKWTTHLIVRKDERSSTVVHAYFDSPEAQQAFHSFLPRVRDRAFFPGTSL